MVVAVETAVAIVVATTTAAAATTIVTTANAATATTLAVGVGMSTTVGVIDCAPAPLVAVAIHIMATTMYARHTIGRLLLLVLRRRR